MRPVSSLHGFALHYERDIRDRMSHPLITRLRVYIFFVGHKRWLFCMKAFIVPVLPGS